ncbi:MAG TPA: SDR family oxidoreductase [Solirubrobacteraceae bacterium]|nr:SDR family oxidoreductase [Solirubrobacteraceae bacterium]
MELRGAVAIVTGGAAGLGEFIVRRLVGEGALVVALDVEEGALAAREVGSSVAFVRGDVRVGADVEHVIAFAVERFGGLDVLVNNAGGISRGAQWPDASSLEWRATLDLNLTGPMLATQLALEPMRARGGGAVVNIASSAGIEWTPYDSPEYGAAKAGLVRFTTCVGALPGVRVNCIAPHWIGLERAHGELAAMSDTERATAPPFVEPEAIADAVVWLVRDESLSGQVVEMPGGSERRLLGTGNERR